MNWGGNRAHPLIFFKNIFCLKTVHSCGFSCFLKVYRSYVQFCDSPNGLRTLQLNLA